MKITLFGYGKMGRLVEQTAMAEGHTVCSRFSGSCPAGLQEKIDADVCIDFSKSESVLDHIAICIDQNIPLVIGTTGWDSKMEEAQKLVKASSIGCLYSPNFSVGVALFTEIVSYAAKIFSEANEYDVSGIEYHHKQKADSPSGTAKNLIRILQNEMNLQNPSFSSVRCGHIPGTHTVHFDGPGDSITLTHTARNRDGFARGAVQAAEWIIGKQGFFTLQDML